MEGRRCVVTRAVREELERGNHVHPSIGDALVAGWLETVRVDGRQELYVFADILNQLGNPKRNAGESSVLAWAKVHGAVIYVDDQEAYNKGRQLGIRVYRTLRLIVEA